MGLVMNIATPAALLALALMGCSSQPAPAPSPVGGTTGGSRTAGRGGAGSGGSAGASATGGSAGTSATGGSAGTGGATPAADAGGADSTGGERPNPPGPDATADAVAASDAPDTAAAATGQGPMAAGTIAYAQDFEKGDMTGLGRSPASITPDRVVVVEDPLGQRGKVLRIQWLPGDDFRSAPQFRPKTFVSNNSAFNYSAGDKVSYAWGYMTDSTYIGATLAQNITGGDPIWMIQGRDQGIMDIVPGLVRLPVRLQAKRWHDFRVDVDYLPGNAGLIEMYIDGQKVYTHRGGLPQGPRGHWDGGIYLTGFGQMGDGNNTPRTVYFSNLSCGRR
jgi:hypothetical protein